jgi:DNA-binding NarL/FixJ family response regulator
MRVLIVDDSSCFRGAARALLERRGYDVVGEAGTAAAAFEQANRLKPAAVLLDVTLPDGTGFGISARLTHRCPALAVLLTSAEDFSSCYGLAEECGARGFVLKSQLAGCDLDRFWPPA